MAADPDSGGHATLLDAVRGYLCSPDLLEHLAARGHERYVAQLRSRGLSSRRSESGEELLVGYDELSEAAKELTRASVVGAFDGRRMLATVAADVPEGCALGAVVGYLFGDGIVEELAAAAHDRWMEAKRSVGVTSRLSETGEEYMVPYVRLSEAAKDLDRATVRGAVADMRARITDLLLAAGVPATH